MENGLTTATLEPTVQPTSGWDVCNHDSPYNDSPEATACREMLLAKPWCSDEASCMQKAFDGDPDTKPSEGTACGAWPENDLCNDATATATLTATATATSTATATATETATATPTPTAEWTATGTATATPTSTAESTATPTATGTLTATETGTPTPPAEWTITPEATSTTAPTAEVILVQADQADVLNAPTGAGEISIAGDVLFGATFAVTALYAALRKRMSRR